MRIVNYVKKHYKLKKFKKYARIGSGFSLCAQSNCFADQQGLITIGDNCEIFGTLYSMSNGKITIGDYTEIRENSFVGSVDEIKIGSYVIISNNIKIYDNNNHPTDPKIRKEMCRN